MEMNEMGDWLGVRFREADSRARKNRISCCYGHGLQEYGAHFCGIS